MSYVGIILHNMCKNKLPDVRILVKSPFILPFRFSVERNKTNYFWSIVSDVTKEKNQ